MQAIFKALELPFSVSSGFYIVSFNSQYILQPYHTAVLLTTTCLVLYSYSLYSQYILQPYRTAVLLTKTCLMLYSDSLYSQYILQPYLQLSCSLRHVWCCTVTVCIHSTFYNLTVERLTSLSSCTNSNLCCKGSSYVLVASRHGPSNW